jgi:hypothetical protein
MYGICILYLDEVRWYHPFFHLSRDAQHFLALIATEKPIPAHRRKKKEAHVFSPFFVNE